MDGTVHTVDDSAHGVAHYIKAGIIMFKIIIVSILLAVAIKAYNDREKHVPYRKSIIALLVINIIIMFGMLVLDLTTEYIFAFFALCLLANYNSFMTIWILTSGVRLNDRRTLG